MLNWIKYEKSEVPTNELILFETLNSKGENEYHTGSFVMLKNQKSVFGIIGGHFYFDRKITRYASIGHLIPNNSQSAGTR